MSFKNLNFWRRKPPTLTTCTTTSTTTTNPFDLLQDDDSDDPNKLIEFHKKKAAAAAAKPKEAAILGRKVKGKPPVIVNSPLPPSKPVKNAWNGSGVPQGQGGGKTGFLGTVQDALKPGRGHGSKHAQGQPPYQGGHASVSGQDLIPCELTLHEWNKIMDERRKTVPNKQTTTEDRRIHPNNGFESMTKLPNKKENDEIFIKLGPNKNGGQQKEALNPGDEKQKLFGQERGRDRQPRPRGVPPLGTQDTARSQSNGTQDRARSQSRLAWFRGQKEPTTTPRDTRADQYPPLKYAKH